MGSLLIHTGFLDSAWGKACILILLKSLWYLGVKGPSTAIVWGMESEENIWSYNDSHMHVSPTINPAKTKTMSVKGYLLFCSTYTQLTNSKWALPQAKHYSELSPTTLTWDWVTFFSTFLNGTKQRFWYMAHQAPPYTTQLHLPHSVPLDYDF